MWFNGDQRGFVLSGIALLLVLPAVLLAASYLGIIYIGGETTSLEALSDKVSYTGHDIERMIHYMEDNQIPIDNTRLNALAENYRAATGLLVEIKAIGGSPPSVSVMVRDSRGAAQYTSVVVP